MPCTSGVSAISAAVEVADALSRYARPARQDLLSPQALLTSLGFDVTAGFSRTQFPQVSLWRLPISLPSAGSPLPQFRLLPGSTEDRVLLQVIDDDQQVGSLSSSRARSSWLLFLLHRCTKISITASPASFVCITAVPPLVHYLTPSP